MNNNYNRKYTFNDAINAFANTNYILLSNESEYKNVNTKLRYLCKKHSGKGEMKITLNHILRGRGCYYCGREKTEKAHIIELDKKSDKNLCESKGFKYIDTTRENGKIIIIFICNNHKELGIQSMGKHNMMRDIHGCKYCSGKQLPKWYIMKKMKDINPYLELLEDYKNLTTRIKCRCTKHNIVTYKTMQNILRGEGCIECGKEKLSQSSYITLEEYQHRVSKTKPSIEVLKYNGQNKDAHFKCKKCGYDWYSNAHYMASSEYGKQCPNCERFYIGEKKVSDVLSSYNIKFIQQYKFDDCKDKRSLPFDFYLPSYNIAIEVDGIQHYKQRVGWTDLELIQKHDNIKTAYCVSHNINLIRIPYWEHNNIELFLLNKFKESGIRISA